MLDNTGLAFWTSILNVYVFNKKELKEVDQGIVDLNAVKIKIDWKILW